MNITVYCGSRPGTDPAFAESAGALGRWIAGHGYGMVYGGGNIGLMEVIADTVLKNGGHVTGVIPEFYHPANADVTVGVYVKCQGKGAGAWGKIDDAMLTFVR